MVTLACERCGSTDLRRAHAHSAWRRAYRKLTGLYRYHCNACHHRGWTRLRPPAEHGHATPTPSLPGRPVESRDRVAHRQAVTARLALLVLAIGLGALIAYLIARQGD